MPRPTLLVVDDEPNILSTLRRALELEGYAVEVAGSGRIALEKLRARGFDAVLLDVAMPEMDGLATLKAMREQQAELPVMMMSGNATLATAVEATKLGACDFLEKPLTTDKVLITVQNALKLARLERDAEELKQKTRADLEQALSIIGGGPRMRRIVETLRKAAPSTARVLITGERGTGKELVARALHELSKRKDAPFVKLNCAAIPSELIESELFGHEKGSFTGATQQRRGKFEQAHGGTLFLDEIGDMTLSAQAKVLRVLQENEVERVGGQETLTVDVRVVAATNKDLKQEIEKGRFRADLYDRLNVVPVEVPPLRERKEDLPALVEHFLQQACAANGKRAATLAHPAMSLLMQHDWPGNVRELKNTVERLVIFANSNVIDEEEVHAALPGVKAVRGRYTRGAALKDLVASAEREIVLAALEANKHHIANTARELGLERSHLYKKMRALGIKHRGEAPAPGEDADAEAHEDDAADPD
jgi:DNA-binding NtrC family response regulator